MAFGKQFTGGVEAEDLALAFSLTAEYSLFAAAVDIENCQITDNFLKFRQSDVEPFLTCRDAAFFVPILQKSLGDRRIPSFRANRLDTTRFRL